MVCLLVIFGYWVSIKKSVFEGDFTFKSLGLVADSIHQCFRVGSELHGYQKRDAFVELGASLVGSARETRVRMYLLAEWSSLRRTGDQLHAGDSGRFPW